MPFRRSFGDYRQHLVALLTWQSSVFTEIFEDTASAPPAERQNSSCLSLVEVSIRSISAQCPTEVRNVAQRARSSAGIPSDK